MLCYYLNKKRDKRFYSNLHSKSMYKRNNVLLKVKVSVVILQGPIENA